MKGIHNQTHVMMGGRKNEAMRSAAALSIGLFLALGLPCLDGSPVGASARSTEEYPAKKQRKPARLTKKERRRIEQQVRRLEQQGVVVRPEVAVPKKWSACVSQEECMYYLFLCGQEAAINRRYHRQAKALNRKQCGQGAPAPGLRTEEKGVRCLAGRCVVLMPLVPDASVAPEPDTPAPQAPVDAPPPSDSQPPL